ncbi:hypothetical protein JX265_003756 [Neoarthrinium moseri]|uniref:FAD synthase n=2 Tax=Neoarthrinium moseri TaxID=1658444 RepID=A0A9P9WSN6_9PEZI|nr:hypothetical protein JX265_003756 [Neoarthrinium moseri]
MTTPKHQPRSSIASGSSRKLVGALSLFAVIAAVGVGRFWKDTPNCRTIPGDASWPGQSIWDRLNETVGGKLIATVPIAAPCHKTLYGEPNGLFDEDACAALRDNWFLPETHLPHPSSPMAYPFSNNSCNPWLDADTPCELGSHAVYTINATTASDLQAGIQFAKEHNIRLVIRNTGHDYLGKSTGAHTLGLWTHHLKSIALVQYDDSTYTGPALKLGAGVEGLEAHTFADANGLLVVGGNCPTVGIAGGFIQGGGHGPLVSKYGLAADQALEFEVITADGKILTASSSKNSDLFWALRGGGAGTFALVTSVTMKAYPDTYVSSASLTVLNNGANADALYSAIGSFIKETLPPLVDAGAFVVWVVAPFGFMVTPAIAPGLTSAQLDEFLQPTIDTLNSAGLEFQYASEQSPTFLERYHTITKATSWNVSDYNLGGRLISRSVAVNDTDNLVEAIRHISSQALMSGVSYNVAHSVSSPSDVAVNPYFREALFGVALGNPINYEDWDATLAAQDRITNDLVPALEKVTPNGASYLSEADFRQANFQQTFYGEHYAKLLAIKRKYDPAGVFYARTAPYDYSRLYRNYTTPLPAHALVADLLSTPDLGLCPREDEKAEPGSEPEPEPEPASASEPLPVPPMTADQTIAAANPTMSPSNGNGTAGHDQHQQRHQHQHQEPLAQQQQQQQSQQQSNGDHPDDWTPRNMEADMRALCHGLKTKVDNFLAADTADDDVLRAVQRQVREAKGVIDKALSQYRPDELALSYNGGKDCLVLLILILASLPPHFPPPSSNPPPPLSSCAPGTTPFPVLLQAIYIRPAAPFPEVDDFVAESSRTYHLDLATSRQGQDMKAALAEYLAEMFAVKAVFVGTRRTDPHGANLRHYQETDGDWPRFMRIHPVIDWHYREIWAFIRALEIPYCPLYDKGYTSLGGTDDTHPNPALKAESGKEAQFRPAYELVEDREERLGRD